MLIHLVVFLGQVLDFDRAFFPCRDFNGCLQTVGETWRHTGGEEGGAVEVCDVLAPHDLIQGGSNTLSRFMLIKSGLAHVLFVFRALNFRWTYLLARKA